MLVFANHDELEELKRSDFAVGREQFLSLIKGETYYFKPAWCGEGTEPSADFWVFYPQASFQALIGTQPFEDAIIALRRSDQAEAAANAG